MLKVRLRHYIGSVCLVIFLLLSACAGQEFYEPELLEQAKKAVVAHNEFMRLGNGASRVNVALMPESSSYLKIFKGDMALLALYRNYPDGSTRFALSMPQGTRLGSCIREANGTLKLESLSPFALMVDMVRSSFGAIDNFIAASPQLEDTWRLQNGDVYAGVKRSEKVLVLQRMHGWGTYSNFVYSLEGEPLAFYGRKGQQLEWKILFRPMESKRSYSYKDYKTGWRIHAEIMELEP